MRNIKKKLKKCLLIVPAVALLAALLPNAAGTSSEELAAVRQAIGAQMSEVEAELSGLQGSADQLDGQMNQLTDALDANKDETRGIIDEKYDIDQKMTLLYQQMDNTNQQIQQYNKLIAARQQELDVAIANQDEQTEKYKERVRAMEETRTVTYISIIFEASNFSDLLDRVDMIREITESNQLVLEQMALARQEVEDAQAALEVEKQNLNEKKDLLAVQNQELEQERLKAEEIITELNEQADQYQDEFAKAEEESAALHDDILAMLDEYNAIQSQYYTALAAEESARAKEQEAARQAAEAEAQRRRQEEEAARAAAAQTLAEEGGEAEEAAAPAYSTEPVSESSFLTPVPSGYIITDAYGDRTNPVTGAYGLHTGVDLAMDSGTSIYASKSGTVVTAGTASGYGNYVVISHSDGQSTLYAHMSSMIVSSGDYVVQGQTIGYVGSTGNSTGPHLHFEVIIDGQTYNPMAYIG